MRDDIELKRALDALPREIEPPHDEWPAIRARIGTRRVPLLRIAALLTLLAISAAALLVARRDAGRWLIAGRDGERPFAAGERVVTGSGTARLTVGSIGTVDVDPQTSAELLEASWSSHRLALRVGTIHARIEAPPRLFIVETPAGTAVDLGCVYTLEVDSAGRSRIHVTAGWVSFEERGQSALIPAGMRAVMRPGGRLGLPVRDSAPNELLSAVALFDSLSSPAAIAAITAAARREDAVTLWHLAGRTRGTDREAVVDRLTALVPPPGEIRRQALLDGDARAMELYWTRLPGTLPIIPEWRQSLWRLWLRVAG